MKELTEWWHEIDGSKHNWLLLGKGPSFETRHQYDLSPYMTVAINHVIREMPVDVASAVNYDVARECADEIYANCRYLLMPRYPHSVPGDPGPVLEEYFSTIPVLEALSREDRLVWYNLSSDPLVPGSPIIRNAGFSVGILFNVLGEMGARRLRTLGVDGGLAYASSFRDMENRTRLASGSKSYDCQFEDMMWAVRNYGLDYAPMNSLTLRERLQMYFRTPASKRAIRRWLQRMPPR